MTAAAPLRRIVVGLEESAECRSGLETAARLAAALAVELHGIYVEDRELLHAAGLPVTALIGFEGGERRTVDTGQMERSLKLRARTLKELLARIAGAHELSWRFETRKGEVTEELLTYASPGDILALGASARRLHAVRPGETGTTLSVSRTASCSLLIAAGTRPAGRVLILAGGAGDATELGLALAQIFGAPVALQPVGPEGPAMAADKALADQIRAVPGGGHILAPRAAEPGTLEALLAEDHTAFVVADEETAQALKIEPAETTARFRLSGILVARSSNQPA